MWVILGLTSAIFLGVYDIFKKLSVKNNAVIPVLFFSTLTGAFIFLPLLIISRFNSSLLINTGFYVPELSLVEHLQVFLKSLIVVSSWILSFFALKNLPITIVAPIRSTSPLWTLLGALLIFKEQLNAYQWTGVLVTLIFFYLFSVAGKLEGISFRKNKWVFFIIGATILASVSGLYDKFIIGRIDRIATQTWFSFYQVIILAPFALFNEKIRKRKNIRFEWRWTILLIGLFLIIADYVYFYALSFEDSLISVIAALRRGSVLITFAIGSIVFQERNLRKKGLLLLGILFGILLISAGSLI